MKHALLLSLAVVLGAAVSVRAADKNPIVIVDTSMGTIKIELYQEKAPITVKNFLAYADDKFYDGTIFHRVIGKPNSNNSSSTSRTTNSSTRPRGRPAIASSAESLRAWTSWTRSRPSRLRTKDRLKKSRLKTWSSSQSSARRNDRRRGAIGSHAHPLPRVGFASPFQGLSHG